MAARAFDRRDLDDLARGAAVLGTGGGGDPRIGHLVAADAVGTGSVPVIPLPEVDDAAFVVAVSQMGAPTVMAERLVSGGEHLQALRTLEAHLGRRADALVAVECGGINSLIPFLVAAQTGLPVVDADGMGRAFPEMQMKTFAAYGLHGTPAAIVGSFGESAVIQTGADNHRMELLARGLAVRMGGVAAVAQFPMTGADLKATAVPGTLSLGVGIGRVLSRVRGTREDPVDLLRPLLSAAGRRHVSVAFAGRVVDVARGVDGGFDRGSVAVRSFTDPSVLTISFQNEFLVAEHEGELVAIVPDLISVVDHDTYEAITTESLRYGQRVRVLRIGSPEVMRSPRALATFGPTAFGLDRRFEPVETLPGPLPG